MEKKKNNAVEKTENAAVKSQKKNSGNAKKTVKKSAEVSGKKSDKAGKAQQKKERKAALRIEKRENKARARAERERIRAEKRVELARIKAQKKAEKEKAKANILREKNRRKADRLAKKAQIKADKEARREMLKRETKKERRKRIAAEKAEKARLLREKRQAKAQLRKQRAAEKHAEKERRAKNRQKNKQARKGYGGWLAAVITLGCATLILTSVLTFTFLMPEENDMLMESAYQKSFYDTVEQVDNIDVNLSKALATGDPAAMQKYLVDAAINSELAENDLQQLPLQDESKYYTTKLVNQIGDYAKYLNNKLIEGESLSDQDVAGLLQLYQANLAFKEALGRMTESMGNDYSFTALSGNDSGDIVISNFNELQNLSVNYPELIYDGPFSDGQSGREIKGLDGEEIDATQARDIFIGIFGGYGIENVEGMGEASGEIECYNVQGMLDGEILYGQISKKGGKLIMFAYGGNCENVKYGEEFAVEKADEFLSAVGIEGMKPVWINLANNVYTINYAFEQDGVIIYPDLVKVRVCAYSANVIGMEAAGYYTNHTERVIGKPVLGKEEAAAKVSENIDIKTARLALVPIGTKTEKLCYEFSGEYDDATYYVYIDAVTGRQAEMFKVIESTEGKLLI